MAEKSTNHNKNSDGEFGTRGPHDERHEHHEQEEQGQLRLLPPIPESPESAPQGETRSPWRLDDETKAIGREGLARARAVLRAARPTHFEPAA